mmetsp:Transcript_71553/g.202998  ORF Transcript_71553/g.202998 Transcript_71553/m.202998 type:complete len:212 (+) Transcript_71553:1246-1881(+)
MPGRQWQLAGRHAGAAAGVTGVHARGLHGHEDDRGHGNVGRPLPVIHLRRRAGPGPLRPLAGARVQLPQRCGKQCAHVGQPAAATLCRLPRQQRGGGERGHDRWLRGGAPAGPVGLEPGASPGAGPLDAGDQVLAHRRRARRLLQRGLPRGRGHGHLAARGAFQRHRHARGAAEPHGRELQQPRETPRARLRAGRRELLAPGRRLCSAGAG